MKKFAKIMAAVLVVAALFSLCACGQKVTLKILDTEYAVEDYAIAVAKENEELLEKIDTALVELMNDGTLDKIVNKYINGVEHDLVFQENVDGLPELKMGTNAEFPPYEFHEDDKIVGIDAEVAAVIADKLGMKLVIEDMAFDSIIASLQGGKIDIGMAGMTVTEDRLKSVNFTTSYAQGVQVVIVPEGSEIDSVDKLFEGGYTIGVQTNTTGDLYSTWDLEDEGLATVERFNKGADAVAAMVAGKLDCVIIDNEPAKAFVEANNK